MPATTTAPLAATGDVLTATNFNYLPRGTVFYATITANQTGIASTVVDLTSFSATWTATSSRLYRTTIYVPEVQQVTAGATAVFRITDGSNNNRQFADMTAATGDFYSINMQVIETSLSGSITRKARANTTSGTLTLTMTSTSPGFILVEDIGAA